MIETTFKEEIETDLFGEQAVLAEDHGAHSSRYETLVARVTSLKWLTSPWFQAQDLINEAGISGMRFSISETAKYGDVRIGPQSLMATFGRR